MRSALIASLAALCLVLLAPRVNAEEPPAQAGRARSRSMALIVGSNRGALVARPDLHFADDDAARYYETFRMLGSAEDVALVTRLDRDSERQHAALRDRARPPTRENVRSSAAALATRAQALRAAGSEVDFYFVYAGHGDVDRGEGFLELEDGRFTAHDLEALLRSVHATRVHVILDSCNSVFMLGARKPGGHHFATGQAAAKQLAERMPNVGVFLSTSAEGEVFEWSELGAGIFSHVVRSGISGSADADGNGSVSYAELRAYVDIATRSVANPRFRPQVFARGPSGRDDVTLFAPGSARGRKLDITPSDERRVTVRDADDVPWVDVHCEANARCMLTIPERAVAGGTVETYRVEAGAMRSVGRFALSGGDDHPLSLAELAPVAVASAAGRGPHDLFRALFTDPFGARAYARYLEEPAPAEAVYGVANADIERHRILLHQLANSGRRERISSAIGTAAAGALGVTTGALVMAREGVGEPWTSAKAFGIVQTTVGASLLAMSPFVLFIDDRNERLREELDDDLLAHPHDRARALARSEQRLFAAADRARRERMIGLAAAGGIACLQLSAFIYNELRADPADVIRYGVGSSLVLLGATAFTQLLPTEVERSAELWRKDPNRDAASVFTPRVSLAPTWGGAMATVGGRF